MFGYVKPVKAELLVKEYEFYRALYCGICRSMKKHTGLFSNVTLSYDSVFLALVRLLYTDGRVEAEDRRCIAHPAKKRPMIKENPAVEYTARAFAVLTYHKLLDDINDERGAKRIAVKTARPILSGANKKAALGDLSETVSRLLSEISGLEAAGCASVDKPAELFGELLGEIFAYSLPEKDRLVPYRCGYHLGKFIYAADAAEDYEKDRKSGKYNPFVIAYGGEALTDENKQTIKCGLLLECKNLEGAINLLPFGNMATVENIINNIIYLGLPERIKFLDKAEVQIKQLPDKEKEI